MPGAPENKRTYAFNAIPSSHIIAETTMLADGLRTYLQEMQEHTFESNWKQENEADQLNSCEVIPEIVERLTDHREWLELEGKNKGYLEMMIRNEQDHSFNHSSCTVMFCFVSFSFIKKILEFRYPDITISDKTITLPKFGFWLPPSFDGAIGSELFAQIFANMNDIKDGLIEEANLQEKSYEEIEIYLNDMSKLYPQGVQLCCALTAGMGTWRNILKDSAKFSSDSEMRYTMLHLAYKFKKRYGNIFQDMSVIDENGNTFGLDSIISSVEAWKKFQIHFAR